VILEKILENKRQEVAAAKSRIPLRKLQGMLEGMRSPRGFARALRQKAAAGTAIIAEVKKGSPSKGVIRRNFEPVEIARRYQEGGATCLSVLTDSKFFLGDLSFLERIADAVSIPLLRKDFIIDPYQLYEARVSGADAALLIAAALNPDTLQDYSIQAKDLGLDVLLEVHNEKELGWALQAPVELIGINNRDLKTFQIDLAVTERLLPMIPKDRLVVSESGINCRADIRRLLAAGVGAFLIGESLMREDDIEGKLFSLLHDKP
jgi:indole-3-glycerol phosphate synthase